MSSGTRHLKALEAYVADRGHARVPVTHVEIVDGDTVALGQWCASQRRRYRRGTLPVDLAQQLGALPGWDWDPRPRGMARKPDRDATVIARRAQGDTIRSIADDLNLSVSRVNQIIAASKGAA